MKTPYTWTRTPPSRPGYYWYMFSDNDGEPEVVHVFLIPGEKELTVQFRWDSEDDCDWVINQHSALWSDHPVPLPRDLPEEGD